MVLESFIICVHTIRLVILICAVPVFPVRWKEVKHDAQKLQWVGEPVLVKYNGVCIFSISWKKYRVFLNSLWSFFFLFIIHSNLINCIYLALDTPVPWRTQRMYLCRITVFGMKPGILYTYLCFHWKTAIMKALAFSYCEDCFIHTPLRKWLDSGKVPVGLTKWVSTQRMTFRRAVLAALIYNTCFKF